MKAASGGPLGILIALYLLLHLAFLEKKKKSFLTPGYSPQFSRTKDLYVMKEQGDRKAESLLWEVCSHNRQNSYGWE